MTANIARFSPSCISEIIPSLVEKYDQEAKILVMHVMLCQGGFREGFSRLNKQILLKCNWTFARKQ